MLILDLPKPFDFYMGRFDSIDKTFEMQDERVKIRNIRSFVHRSRRISKAQQRLETLSDRLIHLSDVDHQPTSPVAAERNASTHTLMLLKKQLMRVSHIALDIGFGMGDSTIALSQHYADFQWIAIDVYSPGIARLLCLINQQSIENIYVVKGDVVRLLYQAGNELMFSHCTTFFPDPWPKKRHHKRRLIQSHFVDLLATCMKPNAYWHIATDSESYANGILSTVTEHPQWLLGRYSSTSGVVSSSSCFQPETKFARRCIKEKRTIYSFVYQRAARY